MSGLFSSPKMPAPPPAPPPAPVVTSPVVQQASQDVVSSQAMAAGRASTILTSGMGDQAAVQTAKKTLLGSG